MHKQWVWRITVHQFIWSLIIFNSIFYSVFLLSISKLKKFLCYDHIYYNIARVVNTFNPRTAG